MDATMSAHESSNGVASSRSDGSTVSNTGDSNLSSISDVSRDTTEKQSLDRTAAQFSHVDLANPSLLEEDLRNERLHYSSYALPARLSEGTARFVKGGIDNLDRPNVLRDEPSKYSLVDSNDVDKILPPPDLLPIPMAFNALLQTNSRVTPSDHWQDVRSLVLYVYPREDLQAEEHIEPYYKPGDVLTIYPKNFPEDVQALIDLMGWGDVADEPFEHHSRQGGGIPGLPNFPQPRNCFPLPNSTLRQLLLHNYDITAIPKRIFIDQIAWHTIDPMHRERLHEFADPKFTDEFYDYTSRPRRSILEILQDFPSVKIPYQEIPSVFPAIRGREYSIASGGELLREPGADLLRVELLVALVKYKTVLRKTRQGLCSRYLESLKPNTVINVTIGDNQGPPNKSQHIRSPLLAIGPGTGIAPIRSLIYDRLTHPDSGDNVVFFGGRNRKADFYFHEDWVDLGVTVHTAFSRDQKEKVYVQDIIRQEAAHVCFLIQRGAIICLCGSAGKMPEAVRQALYDALVMGGLASNVETARHIIEHNVEYWEEVW
ncbi:NAPDH-dependent diflavin reductase [Diatrype stigma]|uniref:NAPDH-dependent diflavin reductase n=1 Tax=Diatrype stigma TaxID=117547 RepID=A0AAN9YTW2_9PEZI